MDQRVKSINTDDRSNKRLRFASAKERSKRASADVYRSYKRRIGVTSAASREERVHHPNREESKRAQKRQKKSIEEKEADKQIVAKTKPDDEFDVTEATFSEELDLAFERNSSETFRDFYREVWPLARSLPEVLHHAAAIINILLDYIMSNASAPHVKSTGVTTNKTTTSNRERFVLNHASADILHLLAVLAKDLRHEIHPYLHTQIMPRIVTDLLNQPTSDENDANKQFIPLDVSMIEAAFRALSYIFRYDADALLAEVSGGSKDPCLESLRQYYGSTLAHRRDLVRRLAAESFAPLVRKLKHDGARKRHLRRVLQALMTASKRQTKSTASAKRMQANAIDGISHFFFEVARGVAGQLHSKGVVPVKVLLDAIAGEGTKDVSSPESRELAHSVTSSFLHNICHHLDPRFFGDIVKEITNTTQRLIEKITPDNTESEFEPHAYMMLLLNQLASLRNGVLLSSGEKTSINLLQNTVNILDALVQHFAKLSNNAKDALLSLLCSTWKAVPNDTRFARKVGRHVDQIVKVPARGESPGTCFPAQVLAKDLIPHLPLPVAMGVVGSAIISTAAEIFENDDTDAGLSLLLAVSQSKPSLEEEEESGYSEDALFMFEGAAYCRIPTEIREKLVDACLLPLSEGDLSHYDLNRLGVACRCISFVVMTSAKDEDDKGKVRKELSEKALKWLLEVFRRLAESGSDSETYEDRSITASLALESLSRLATEAQKSNIGASSTKKLLRKPQKNVETFLLSHPASTWALKGSAAYVQALQLLEVVLDQRDEIFDALVPNLRSPSHFRRLYSLQILGSFPKKHFVTDHADVDYTDDLDEEGDSDFARTHGDKSGNARSGLCDILDTMLSIESMPVKFESERQLLSLISRIEILGRTARIPVVYTEAAANHMLGILNIKFAPVWPVAVRAFVSLAAGQDAFEISPLRNEIAKLMNSFPAQAAHACDPVDEEKPKTNGYVDHLSVCRLWAESNGTVVSIFGIEESNHLPTDDATVLQHLWSVLELSPQIMTKYNRKFVPIYLEFMHAQFYSFYSNDPDARELCIEDHIEVKKRYDRSVLQGHLLQKRLISMLKVFAAIKGPKQLYKQKLLLATYMSLLGQETAIAQLAFSCIKTYKLPFLTCFSDIVEALYAKGGLRESLLKFVSALETSNYDKNDKHRLIPLVMRVLFGRLSARTGGNKSSKDSPAARRAAILNFISVLCRSEEDLYPFLYLMIRSYVPTSLELIPVEQHEESLRTEVLQAVISISTDHLASLPVQVHIGFLHLLEPVVGQLGHRVDSFVHQFTSIILVLCKLTEVKQPSSSEATPDEGDDDDEDNDEEMKSTRGFGSIRSLCFRRLSEIFAQYASVVDFSVYGPTLWDAIMQSVIMLPSTVKHCGKVPALLSLMQTLSSNQTQVPLLSIKDEVVPCVIKCLAGTSCSAVVDTTLSFIDNLLTSDESGSAQSDACLAKRHIDLILSQFMLRLGWKEPSHDEDNPGNNQANPKNNNGDHAKRPMTWRRELRILCRITEIISETTASELSKGGKDEVAAKLCTLLVPYLHQGGGVTELDQMNVLQIMEALIPRVGTDTGETLYKEFARLLGPVKGKAGIVSIPVRQGIATVLSRMPREHDTQASKVGEVLRDLCKSHPKRIDEMDYDSVVPALNRLVDDSSGSSWYGLATIDSEVKTDLILPLISTCLHYLFNDDGVVSRGSFKALKTLIAISAERAGLDAEHEAVSDGPENGWCKLLEKTLVPAVRAGLTTRNVSVRRFYILLIAECASKCNKSSKPNLYGDLAVLIRDDEPDLDFFLNITHVQMHRRTRAFQRLRKLLSTSESDSATFTLQSLSNVLLPIALHPVYESTTKAEEPFAIEAIATVGAISRHLSWSKYSSILWTTLTQFHRHEQQERYLVGAICAVIDGFHFDISDGKATAQTVGEAQEGENAILRALERRFIPKIETLLTKETVDRRGNKSKSLRASLILALVKLFKKFKKERFELRLPRLLTVICDGLKSRESDSRDIARETLAKVAVDIDIDYLPDILREVAIALNDGFRLHVRMATVHSILLALSEVYSPPTNNANEESVNMPFDRSVPALMDIIQQDLFGAAQERKDVEGAHTRYVKEAGGSKNLNSIEVMAALIVFRPSIARGEGTEQSSIHAIVTPLLERLKVPNVEVTTIRRVKECLTRVVVGLSRNPSIAIAEVLPFVYATAIPFIGMENLEATAKYKADDSDDDEDLEDVKPLRVSGSADQKAKPSETASAKAGTVVSWRPSALKNSTTSKQASDVRQKESHALRKVQDGASAPKMTGSARYASAALANQINDPANVAAVVFSLRLLHSILKKRKMTASEPNLLSLVDPFVPLLTACVCTCRETDVILLALRCLGIFLVFDLPSKETCAPSLASKTLELLGTSGVGASQDNDLSQACFKMMILLMNIDRSADLSSISTSTMIEQGEGVLSGSKVMPLDPEQMKVLLSFVQESIVDSENHNAALNLIRAIMSRRFVSSEFYDLMDTVLELSVRSSKASLRQQCAGIVVNFLLNYPMGDERLEEHLKQIVLNIKYEFEEGRLSGINLLTMVVDKVPEPVLEKHIQLFFLPLTLQLVNDSSEKCREGVALCLSRLLRRVSTDVIQSLYDFAVRWSGGNADVQRASLQLFGLFVDSCENFMERGDTAAQLVERLKMITTKESADGAWEVFYFSLLCLEKLAKMFPAILSNQPELWGVVIKCLVHSHPFVKLVASRLVLMHLESLDVAAFVKTKKTSFLIQVPGSLYETARNLCFQLNSEESQQSDEMTSLCIKALCWILPAMKQHPELCYSEQENNDDSNPVGWVMKRLSSMAKPKGPKRRQAVFKAFGAFAAKCPEVIFPQNLELMIEPLHRVDVETANDAERPEIISQRSRGVHKEGEAIPEEASLARDVLRMLEDKCDPPDAFLTAYANVKTRAMEKKESRKLQVKSEAVRDPVAAAKRRQGKNEQEKKRKKRRVEDRRRDRGALGKGRRKYAG